ncbi:MAG: TonB C-terminal domain-containing protein [Deltaproteobacteria bacterium]|jgi:outer membrane biosynthesis protein TonB|nr:TonB C-terminal domain-containing protein [Deltaproteobacteria bacterium]
MRGPQLYVSLESALERRFMPLLALSLLLHGAALIGADWLGGWLAQTADRELPFEVMTVQLLGAVEPPAPAAPAAPVDPDLKGPDVVEMPQSEPILPQPTPLERIIAPVVTPEVIPLGERPPTEPPAPAVKNPEPPPKAVLPEKKPEPKPEPKPETKPAPKRQNPDAVLNKRRDELKRKIEAEKSDEAINSAIADLAKKRGPGSGTSSLPPGSSGVGAQLDAARRAYYIEVLQIVRANWVPPATALSPDLSATFVIVIQPNGRISGKSLRFKSGNVEYDQSVEQAINRSSFPPLPDVFEGADNPALQFNLDYLNRG